MTDEQAQQLLKAFAEAKEELAFYKEKCERIFRQYDNLLHSFKEFQRHRFGSRSEKFIDPDAPQQVDMFAEKKVASAVRDALFKRKG